MTFRGFRGPNGGADCPILLASEDGDDHCHGQSRCCSCGDACAEEHERLLPDTTLSVRTVVATGGGRSWVSCYQSALRMRAQQSATREEKFHSDPGSDGA